MQKPLPLVGDQASDAAFRGNALMIKLMGLFNDYFKLNLNDQVEARIRAYFKVWNLPT